MLDKPKNQKELLDTVWLLLVGAEKDSLVYKIDKIFKIIEDFIRNQDAIRENSCPYRTEINNLRSELNLHIAEHDKTKKKSFDNRGQFLIIIGIAITIIFQVLNLLVK